MKHKYPEDPLQCELIDALYGRQYYTDVWNSRPWFTKLYAKVTGTNPGGRKGAPRLIESK